MLPGIDSPLGFPTPEPESHYDPEEEPEFFEVKPNPVEPDEAPRENRTHAERDLTPKV